MVLHTRVLNLQRRNYCHGFIHWVNHNFFFFFFSKYHVPRPVLDSEGGKRSKDHIREKEPEM